MNRRTDMKAMAYDGGTEGCCHTVCIIPPCFMMVLVDKVSDHSSDSSDKS